MVRRFWHRCLFSLPRHSKEEAGSIAVEFALIAPLFFLLLFAAYELGIYLHNQQVITNASREAARLGIVMKIPRTTQAEMEQKVIDFTKSLVGQTVNCVAGGGCPDVVFTGLGGASGSPLTVRISIPYQFPLLSTFSTFLPDIPIEAETTMMFE